MKPTSPTPYYLTFAPSRWFNILPSFTGWPHFTTWMLLSTHLTKRCVRPWFIRLEWRSQIKLKIVPTRRWLSVAWGQGTPHKLVIVTCTCASSLETFTQSFLHRVQPKTCGPERSSRSALIVATHVFSWSPVRLRHVQGGVGRRISLIGSQSGCLAAWLNWWNPLCKKYAPHM